MKNDKAAAYRKIFGKRIQQLRHQQGWTLQTFASRMEAVAKAISTDEKDCKIPPSSLAAIEQGRHTPSIERLFLLASVFNTSVSFLLGEVSQDGLNKTLVTKLNSLPPTSKAAIINMIEVLSDNAIRGL